MKKGIVAIVLALALCLVAVGCSGGKTSVPERAAEQTVEHFYDCVNRFDVEGAVSCLDSKSAGLVNGAIQLASQFTPAGENTDESIMEQLLAPLYPAIGQATAMANGFSYSFKPTNLKATLKDSTHATVTDTLNVSITVDGETKKFTQEETIALVLEDNQWKIDAGGQIASALESAFSFLG